MHRALARRLVDDRRHLIVAEQRAIFALLSGRQGDGQQSRREHEPPSRFHTASSEFADRGDISTKALNMKDMKDVKAMKGSRQIEGWLTWRPPTAASRCVGDCD
jgi:hypothetical protein